MKRLYFRFSGKFFKITSFFAMILLIGTLGCSKNKSIGQVESGPIKKLRESVEKGNYDEALKISKEISNHTPPGIDTEEALYIEAYILAYGKSDFQGARSPLKQLLDFYPNGPFASDSQKLLADCHYWQGHYEKAGKEYKKLSTSTKDNRFASYAQMQLGNCLLLDDKVGDALTTYRELVEKYPTDSIAASAQLMIANSYLKLQNYKQAKSELQKLMSFTRDSDIQRTAQKALRQIEEEEPFRKGVGVTE